MNLPSSKFIWKSIHHQHETFRAPEYLLRNYAGLAKCEYVETLNYPSKVFAIVWQSEFIIKHFPTKNLRKIPDAKNSTGLTLWKFKRELLSESFASTTAALRQETITKLNKTMQRTFCTNFIIEYLMSFRIYLHDKSIEQSQAW